MLSGSMASRSFGRYNVNTEQILTMPEKPVIVDNSPLVALWKLGLLFLLRSLYTEVLIPKEVETEFLNKERKPRQIALDKATWLSVVQLATPLTEADYIGLDRGEAAVLALAEERGARLVIFDDSDARQYARDIGLPFKGTVGVLLEAKENGLIDTIKPLLTQMQTNGIYLGKSVIDEALQQAGEKA